MKIVLVCCDSRNIGLEFIAAILKKNGHQVECVFDPLLFYRRKKNKISNLFDYSKITVANILSAKPDLIGFSVYTDSYGWALKIASELKKVSDTPIIFGGLHATCVPEKVITASFVDYVCVGEGEEAIVELVDQIANNRSTTDIKNIWSKQAGHIIHNAPRELILDLDRLPFPEEGVPYGSLFYLSWFCQYYIVLTTRGCPYQCSFCMNTLLSSLYKDKGNYVRRRSVDNVLNELVLIKNNYNVKSFCFGDDIFTLDKAWLLEFSEKYKEKIALPFLCQSHPLSIDLDRIRCLEKAGCVTVVLGVETINPRLSEDVLNRFVSQEAIIEVLELLQKSTLFSMVDLLLDFPQSDDRLLLDTARFLNRYRPDEVIFFKLRYYPKMLINDLAKRLDILSEKDISDIEEAKKNIPFIIGTRLLYQKNLSGIIRLLFISHKIPAVVMDCLLSKQIFQKSSLILNVVCHLYLLLVQILTTIFSKKKRVFLVTFSGLFRYLGYTCWCKFIYWWKKNKL